MKRISFVILLCAVCVICGSAFAKKHVKPSPGGGAHGTPLTITIVGVPAGTVGTAYNFSLTASGGTTPYVWSITSCAGGTTGCLPPVLALNAASGAITGTPSASGLYSFTARVTDAAAHTYSLAYGLTIADPAPPAPPPTYLFTNGFEGSGGGCSFAAWDYLNHYTPTDLITQSVIKKTGNCAMQGHYVICPDPTNPACGANSQDINLWAAKRLAPLNHVFMRGYVYFKTPTTLDTSITQRKMMWVSDATSADGSGENYSLVLVPWTGTGGTLTPNSLYLSFFSQGGSCFGSQAVDWMATAPPLTWNTWYSVEMEIQNNTPGPGPVYDGIVRVWVSGVLVGENTAFKVNGACANPMDQFTIGRQTNRYNYMPVDDYRYWDDVVINTSYIGP